MSRSHSEKEIIDALYEAKGLVSIAAKSLNIVPQALYLRAKNNPTIAKAIQTAREINKDYVESKLMQRIDSDDTTAIIFYLKTQAKDRGYVEKQETELTGKDGNALTIRYVNDWRNSEGE